MPRDTSEPTRPGRLLHESRPAKVAELLVVFVGPIGLLVAVAPLAGGDPLRFQILVAGSNVLMLALIWTGLRLRGQDWSHFGLRFARPTPRAAFRAFGTSLLVFVVAVIAFLVGAVVAANIFGVPEGPDTSGYAYMSGNLPMLILALSVAYVVSSFGEEAVYRGFLINRIAELAAGPGRWMLAVVGSSLLFGLAHFSWGPSGMVQTGFMGLALGAAYLRLGRNLWLTVLAHAYMDTILFVQMYLAG
jgi:membrane protease YdiL (CAAX protease family)